MLLLVATVVVCPRCISPPSAVLCVCVRELLLGVSAAGMMVPLTVDGWRCSLFHPFLGIFSLHFLNHTRGSKQTLNATVKFEGTERTNNSTHTHIYMLSRVAAVMAPRTHNRGCVTGSRGRRRKGKESEPQRPNMSRCLFNSTVLLFAVVMMCCGTGGAAAADDMPSDSGSSPEKLFHWRDKKGEETVSSLYAPSLVEVNGNLFAVAEAQCKKNEGCDFTGVASELLALTDEKPKGLDKSKLKTQVLVKRSSGGEQCPSQTAVLAGTQRMKKVHVSGPTTVVQGSDIYMLAGNYSWAYEDNADSVSQSGLLLVKGNISGEENGNKRILWKDTYDLPWISNGRQEQSWTRLIGGGGSGIKIKGNTLLLPLEGTKKEDGKAVSLIMYSSDTAGWTVSREMSAGGCGDPSVVEREKDKKLMMMTACDDGRRRVYEFTLTESWTEALGTLSRVWSNKKGAKGVRSGFITATIENRDVMLVTLPVYANTEREENGKGVLHLWLTDNTHIVDIGPVSGEDDAAASSLLYRSGKSETNGKEELIALYEKKTAEGEKPSSGMVSVRLTAQLKRVKEVLATWNKVDGTVSQLCTTLLAQKGLSTDNACGADKITAGLVGFLSGSFSGDTWRDEYLGVNATIKGNDGGATKTSDVVTFHGAWAEWPVGAQGENQLYHFANYNFTLVATVSIHKVPEGGTPIPLMGVKKKKNGAGSSVFLGLSYNNKNKWQLRCGDEKTTEHSSSWKPETTHHVAIVLRNGNQSSAYVDGQRVGGDAPCTLGSTDLREISHFYIGGDGGSTENKESRGVVPVTVANVLLYNRPLDDSEIAGLAKNKINIPKPVAARTSSPAVSRPKPSSESLARGTTGAGTARHFGANGDGSTVCGSGLLLLLLLLGLWGFAAL
ncbi:putative trans-sialidase, Group V [Trypanosoma cruzi]|uniref:Trans-sialidase, putative n=2 Tax=Trypanosoma cruzi TaxID=5693 RepID=Q4DAA3_TRYCC|nr:trans-sialidase, putative [Trypanosoma cruzi]EAN89453.1 trans-sialidase, putative [Trypanosoma cruzi]PWV04217.1 putative trans-sialidase, Group V [Trypanosoma cruzi]|eukprot:XP_811304.1 trans-sialidase [Trypanosoma cruzi strain CL Brener]